jgi:hypothetical protein
MKIPKIIYSDKILKNLSWFMSIGGITLYPWIILKEQYDVGGKYHHRVDTVIKHESIHIKQQAEMLVLPFYVWYIIEGFLKFFKYGTKAYHNISFEREAHENDEDPNYLETRKFWGFLKYVWT